MDIPSAIIAHLEKSENKRLQAYIDQLVTQNCQLMNTPVLGFLYEGLPYRHSTAAKGKMTLRAAHPEIHAKLEDFLASCADTTSNMQFIKQALATLCRPVITQQDLRDALPECLLFVLDEAGQKLERTRPEAWTIQDNPRALKQYLKILPKIQFYTAARLIY